MSAVLACPRIVHCLYCACFWYFQEGFVQSFFSVYGRYFYILLWAGNIDLSEMSCLGAYLGLGKRILTFYEFLRKFY